MAEFMFPNVAYRATVYRTGYAAQSLRAHSFKLLYFLYGNNSKWSKLLKRKILELWTGTSYISRNHLLVYFIFICFRSSMIWSWFNSITVEMLAAPRHNNMDYYRPWPLHPRCDTCNPLSEMETRTVEPGGPRGSGGLEGTRGPLGPFPPPLNLFTLIESKLPSC